VISIGYWSPLPQVSFILANALLITYLEDQRAENARAREAAVSWLLKAESGSGQASQSKQIFYNDLHRKATDLETERRDLPNPARLVSLAELPLRASSPKRLRLLAAGFAITTVLAGFLAVRREEGDQRIRLPRDVQALTSEAILAPLPLPAAWRGIPRLGLHRQKRLSVLEETATEWGSPLADAARTLYMRLALGPNWQGRCILIASAAPKEGKTFTTIALARAAAENGRQVLVIDCDLRSSAGARRTAGGLAAILRGELEPQEAAIQTNLKGLQVLEAGLAESNPAMLFIDGQLQKLMNWASQYDLILLDGPSGFVPETQILAARADGLLWCVRWGKTLLCDAKADLQGLRRQGVRVLGIAVTMVNQREMRYY
jgi:Mrp family chromosome partitioning ATPase